MSHTILVIEDNQDVRENIEEILEIAGYDVHAAADGIEGVKAAKSIVPDLIVCDVMMPRLDGYGVLYSLSKEDEMASIPFIFLTAKVDKDDVRKGMRLGADDYLTKPFDETDLLLSIENRIKKSQLIKARYESTPMGIEELIGDACANEKELLANTPSSIYEKKEKIFREDEYPHYIYYLNEGIVKLSRIHEDGKELITGLVNEGSFFGYTPVILDAPYYHSAESVGESSITKIAIADFKKLMESNAEFNKTLFKILSGNIRTKENELLEIAYGTVRKRVAEGLVKIASSLGNDGIIDLSREEIANVIGIAQETLIRTMSDFKKEGLIVVDKRKIHLPDPTALSQLKF